MAIRWCIEQDVIVIPKSSNGDRIVQNASAIDIVLTEEDQRIMALCDCGFKASNSVNSMDVPWEEVA